MSIEEILSKYLFVYKVNDDLFCIGHHDGDEKEICYKCSAQRFYEISAAYNRYLDCLSKVDKEKLRWKQLDLCKDADLKELVESFKDVKREAKRQIDIAELNGVALDSALTELSNPKVQTLLEVQMKDYIAVQRYVK